MGGTEVTLQVDPDGDVPLILAAAHDHAVAHHAGVVDHDIEPAERVDGRLDQALGAIPVGDIVAIGDGRATPRPDQVDHLAGRAARRTGAVELGADVVDHDHRALVGELQGVAPADAPAGAGDDHDTSLTDHVLASKERAARSHISNFITLPLALSGRASTISTVRGTL